jgi:hypothetical protein
VAACSFWHKFDKRTLRLRVLPALMTEWQTESMRNAVLPLVLAMVQELPTDHFQVQILPQLRTLITVCISLFLLVFACLCFKFSPIFPFLFQQPKTLITVRLSLFLFVFATSYHPSFPCSFNNQRLVGISS